MGDLTLPAPGFASVVGPAVFRFPGDGVPLAPGLAARLVKSALLLFGALFVGNEFFHGCLLFGVEKCWKI